MSDEARDECGCYTDGGFDCEPEHCEAYQNREDCKYPALLKDFGKSVDTSLELLNTNNALLKERDELLIKQDELQDKLDKETAIAKLRRERIDHLDQWFKQEAERLKWHAPLFEALVVEAELSDEFGGSWEDLLVPHIIRLEKMAIERDALKARVAELEQYHEWATEQLAADSEAFKMKDAEIERLKDEK